MTSGNRNRSTPGPLAKVAVTLFFGVFMLVGLGIFWWLLGHPLHSVLAARGWSETPCTVDSSTLRSHAGDDGPTYSIDILYRYTVSGRELRSSRFDFSTGSSSGSAAKQAVVDRYPVGSPCTCFVDPGDPTRAVLDRSWRSSYWAGLLGLPFFLAGAGGLVFTTWRARRARRPLVVPVPTQATVGGPVILRPRAGPWKKLLLSLVINLIWNGVVGVFLVVLAAEWQKGNREWVPILIVSVFGLIGLLLLVGLGSSLLALGNPRPVLELERGALAPGDWLTVRWRLRGFASRLARLRFAVEGEEQVNYTTRSNNRTTYQSASSVFFRADFFDTGGAPVPAAGEALLRLPADTMHTLAAPHNRVCWRIRVSGEIPRWPDLEAEYPISVLPPEAPR